MQYSKYQLQIFDHIGNGNGNAAVNAVAGSGKTFTICKAMEKISAVYNVFCGAFGNDIVTELRGRGLPEHIRIQSYNAFGWEICRDQGKRLKLDKQKTEKILQQLMGVAYGDPGYKDFMKIRFPIKRMVSLLKAKVIMDRDKAAAAIPELIERYDIDLPGDKVDILLGVFDKSINHSYFYDFDDQIYQVLRQEMTVPEFDHVFVDEFQDTNDMQAKMMLKCGGQFVAVGDPDQAIYGFRGATPGAFDGFVKDFGATVLPLSISYRCSLAVINEAKKIVPRIEAAPGAVPGIVDKISTYDFMKRVTVGDFVICRTVAPLVKRCLAKIREGVPAKILGRELGTSLEYVIDKVSGGANLGIEVFGMKLEAYLAEQVERCEKMGISVLALEDKVLTIQSLMADCDYVSDLSVKIGSIFSDDVTNCIKFMTGHKCKGLENRRVFLIRPDLIPHPRSKGHDWMMEEEKRLMYVINTRSSDEFYYVVKEPGER